MKGIPVGEEEDNFFYPSNRNLIVIDDLMTVSKNDTRIADLFSKGSHHRNLSVIYIVQNLFPQGKASRDIALNAKYMILFNNPIGKDQIADQGRRMFPNQPQKLVRVYEEAVATKPHGYLLVDLSPSTQEHCRLRANLLPGEMSKDNVIPAVTPLISTPKTDLITALAERQTVTANPTAKRMREIQNDMNAIMHRTDISPCLKSKRYAELQNIERQYKKQYKQNIQPPKVLVQQTPVSPFFAPPVQPWDRYVYPR